MAGAKRELVTTVYVNHVAYGPGDDVQAEVAKQITNPKAWGEGSDSADKTPAQAASDKGFDDESGSKSKK